MSYLKNIVIIISSLAFLSACTTRPSNITAMSVSPIIYDGTNCDRLKIELTNVEQKISILSGDLEKDANVDTALVIAGFLFVPLWFGTMATGGKAKEQELGNLKGQKEAMKTASIGKNCNFDFQAIDTAVKDSLDASIQSAKAKCEASGLKPQSEEFGKCVLGAIDVK
jgi:hypothetical protein